MFLDKGMNTLRSISDLNSEEDKVHEIKLECGDVIHITKRAASHILSLNKQMPSVVQELLEPAPLFVILFFYTDPQLMVA